MISRMLCPHVVEKAGQPAATLAIQGECTRHRERLVVMVAMTVSMSGCAIVLLRKYFYPRPIAGIDAAGRFWLKGYVRNAESGLQNLPRRLQQWRPIVEIIQVDMRGKRHLA